MRVVLLQAGELWTVLTCFKHAHILQKVLQWTKYSIHEVPVLLIYVITVGGCFLSWQVHGTTIYDQ